MKNYFFLAALLVGSCNAIYCMEKNANKQYTELCAKIIAQLQQSPQANIPSEKILKEKSAVMAELEMFALYSEGSIKTLVKFCKPIAHLCNN